MSTTIESIDTVSQVQTVQPLDSVDSVQIKAKEAEPLNAAVTNGASISNLLALAVELSFSQIGLFGSNPTSSDGDFSSVPALQTALVPFMDSLLNALQAQSTQNSESPARQSPADIALNIANSGAFGISGYEQHHYYHNGENNGLLADLQNLIRKVASVDPISSVGRYDNSALLSLIQNYQMLLESTGTLKKTGLNITLDTFLKAFLKNIQDGDPEGNFIDTID